MTEQPTAREAVDHFVRGMIYAVIFGALTELLAATNASAGVVNLLLLGVLAAFFYMVLPYVVWGWGIAIDRVRAWEGGSA